VATIAPSTRVVVVGYCMGASPISGYPMKYVVTPEDGDFLDFALPSDMLAQGEQEAVMHDCLYCQSMHYGGQTCPTKPKR
jgi:hypothetical protein